MTIKQDKLIDTCGTRCPIPLLRAKQALKSMEAGEVLKVLTSDPSAEGDFKAMLKHLPHELLSYESESVGTGASARVDVVLIRKGIV